MNEESNSSSNTINTDFTIEFDLYPPKFDIDSFQDINIPTIEINDIENDKTNFYIDSFNIEEEINLIEYTNKTQNDIENNNYEFQQLLNEIEQNHNIQSYKLPNNSIEKRIKQLPIFPNTNGNSTSYHKFQGNKQQIHRRSSKLKDNIRTSNYKNNPLFRTDFLNNNSPIDTPRNSISNSISNSIENDFYTNIRNGSGSGSGSNSSDINGYSTEDSYNSVRIKNNNMKYKKYNKLTYRDVEKYINKYYNTNNDNKYSNEIDILTTYVNGQKNIYIQAKYITQYKLNLLTFPSIIITSIVTIVAPFIECEFWSAGLISGLNAIIMLLLSLINYLRYESAIEIYLQNSKQFDKLETALEIASTKLNFIHKEKQKNILVLNKINEFEKKIEEIKNSTNVLIPEEIKRLFPIICNINIFSFIKKLEVYKKNLINKLLVVKNEILYILYKWDNNGLGNNEFENNIVRINDCSGNNYVKEKNRLLFLYELKNKIKQEILELCYAYTYIDNIFVKEINNAEYKKNKLGVFHIIFCKYNIEKTYCKTENEFINKYFLYNDS